MVWHPGRLISPQSQSQSHDVNTMHHLVKLIKKEGVITLFNFQLDHRAIHQSSIGAPHSLVLLSDFRGVELDCHRQAS